MSRYQALLFDLCDTLVHFDAERLPLIEINGRPTHSTALAIHQALTATASIPFDEFYTCLLSVTAEIAAARDRDHREITSHERFRRALARLGTDARSEATDRLVAAHMTRLAEALVLPPHHRNILEALGKDHRLAIVTNFDHAPTVRDVLKRDRIESCFDVVVISGEVGWRKPHRLIFEAALERLGLEPEAAFFVGDNYDLDVVGASGVGMAAAWYARGQLLEARSGYPIISDLADLHRLL